MLTTKETGGKNPPIATRISVIDTFRSIRAGTSYKFSCKDFAPFGSARAAVSRLNSTSGCEAYKIATTDNGATYTVEHIL